jgi:hypothetical protein
MAGPVGVEACCCWLVQADRMRARAAKMDSRIVNFDGNILVTNAFRALEFDVQVYGKRLIRVNICDWE